MTPFAPPASTREYVALKPVFHVIGWFLTAVGLLMILPAIVDLGVGHGDWKAFAASATVTVFLGIALILSTDSPNLSISRRQGFVLTTGIWIFSAAFGAMPMAFSELNLTYTDAYFEAMSGLTTTGSTVIIGLDTAPPGILLWRGLLQWIGGIGFIVVGMAMLPFLRVGGMQLFRTESSERSDKIVPQARRFAGMLLLVYIALTTACAVLLDFAGMTHFEAVVHAMTTISTGGFSTSDGSVGHFDSWLIEWILVVFMIASSLPFVVYARMLRGRPGSILRESQIRSFIRFIVFVVLAIAFWLWYADGFAPLQALTKSAFNVVSILTTTGYASTDYTQWGSLPLGTFFLLTFIGGCTGSTAGGLKIFRFQMLGVALRIQVRRLIYPHAAVTATYQNRPVSDDVITGVILYMGVYLLTTAATSVALEFMGVDLLTSVTGAATAVGNVGPGLGALIGPTGNFDILPDGAKWVLAAAMLLGRLEIFTVIVLLSPRLWRE
jgi:trk system potassium uptake protein TrkH